MRIDVIDRLAAATHGGSLRRRVAYNTAAQVSGRLLAAAMAVAVLRLTTRYLGPADYGAVVAAAAFVMLLTTLTDWGMGTVAGREIAREPAHAATVLGTSLAMRLVLSLALIPITLGVAFGFYHGHPRTFLAVAVMSPLLVLTALQSAAGAVLIARQRNDLAAVADVGSRLATLAAVVAVVHLDLGFAAYLWTVLVGGFVAALITVVSVVRYVPLRPLFAWTDWRRLFLLALPLGLVQIANVVYLRMDSVLLSLMRSPAEVGRYGVAYKVIELLMAVPSFFMLALLPSVAVASKDRARALVQRAFDVLVAAAVPVAVGGVILAPGVVTAVSNRSYVGAATAFAILAVGAGASFVGAVGGNALVAMGAQRRLLRLTVIVLVANLALNLAAIPRFGIDGAAAATAATELFAMVYVTMLFTRSTGISIRLAQARRALLAGAVMIAAGVVLRVLGFSPDRPVSFMLTAAVVATAYSLVFGASGGVAALLRPPRDA